jgi:hypothetical protein
MQGWQVLPKAATLKRFEGYFEFGHVVSIQFHRLRSQRYRAQVSPKMDLTFPFEILGASSC